MPVIQTKRSKLPTFHYPSYPTPMDARRARIRNAIGYAALFATFAGLGILLAWRV